MNNKDIKQKERFDVVKRASEKITETNRILYISGIGIVWLFLQLSLFVSWKNYLIIALLFLVCSLFLEYVHYLIEIIVNWIYSTILLTTTSNEEQVRNLPTAMIWISWILWFIKIILSMVAFLTIGFTFLKVI